MQSHKTVLIADEVQKTIQKLYLRIKDRFPQSNLANVCNSLYTISKEADQTVVWIAKPNYTLRVAVCAGIVVAAMVAVREISAINVKTEGINIAELVQMAGATLDGVVLIGGGIVFLVTLENRRKRQRVIHAVNHLRCIAHIIDMHQLTKDPDSVADTSIPTPHSPTHKLTEYELARYLDYCTEMLSLVSKTAFLYIQDFHDPVATEAVNDLEDLCTGLSRKMWQKIMMIHTKGTLK
jgi:hypothetical protein